MTTDSERREVARRLRAIEPDDFGSYSEEHEFVEKALGIWDDYDKFLWGVVADLIEPGEPKTTCVAEGKIEGEKLDEAVHRAMAEYAGIDRDALLALADEMGRIRNRCDFCIKNGECDWADETICLEKMMDDYARRIREALGVSDA